MSRERRPDIVLVLSDSTSRRSLILDAKWRSKREYVLEAMESAHIYHDALRIGAAQPQPCLLLIPGETAVPELEQEASIEAYGVGTISSVKASGTRISKIQETLKTWINSGTGASD